jgi:DNA adenine methylase
LVLPVKYLGGKHRIAKELADFMLSRCGPLGHYWEPFIGGGSVFEQMAPHFLGALGTDIHPDLIMLYQALLDGWEPPAEITEEQYKELRNAEPSALRAVAGFPCSFGGKWFGGYARDRTGVREDYVGEARRGLLRFAAAVKRTDVLFRRQSYLYSDSPFPGTVVYCDPPYAGTTAYSGTAPFNPLVFWDTAKRWADVGCQVYVSEYDGLGELVWEKERNSEIGGGVNGESKKVIERLWYLAP